MVPKKSSTSKSSEKGVTQKVEEINPVGRPTEIVKLTSNDGLSVQAKKALDSLSENMKVTPTEVVKCLISRASQEMLVIGVRGMANRLSVHKRR